MTFLHLYYFLVESNNISTITNTSTFTATITTTAAAATTLHNPNSLHSNKGIYYHVTAPPRDCEYCSEMHKRVFMSRIGEHRPVEGEIKNEWRGAWFGWWTVKECRGKGRDMTRVIKEDNCRCEARDGLEWRLRNISSLINWTKRLRSIQTELKRWGESLKYRQAGNISEQMMAVH